MSGTSSSGSVTVHVDRWTIRIYRASLLNTVPMALAFCAMGWLIGMALWGVALAALVTVVLFLQNRYLVVEAELGEALLLSYLGGRQRSVSPQSVELPRRSLWRLCFYGGFPLVDRTGWRCLGGFYPTLEWDDLDALSRWLEMAQVQNE